MLGGPCDLCREGRSSVITGDKSPETGIRVEKRSDREAACWLALSRYHALSPADISTILQHFGSLAAAWDASESELVASGISSEVARRLIRYMDSDRLREGFTMLGRLRDMSVNMITWSDHNYPVALREQSTRPTASVPLVIFHRGALTSFRNCVAVVGTRRASFRAHTLARRIARALASRGRTVVSGLARGVDTEAHCGALEAKEGRTVAVLPWMDPVYPPENSELLRDIEKRGAVISENLCKPKGIKSSNYLSRGKFVERNRITSGISDYLIAVESGETGGTIHQVKIALSQGKEVFVPRPERNRRAERGFQLLISLGAKEMRSLSDLPGFGGA